MYVKQLTIPLVIEKEVTMAPSNTNHITALILGNIISDSTYLQGESVFSVDVQHSKLMTGQKDGVYDLTEEHCNTFSLCDETGTLTTQQVEVH